MLGTEDFVVPEHKYKKDEQSKKFLEICDYLQAKEWDILVLKMKIIKQKARALQC